MRKGKFEHKGQHKRRTSGCKAMVLALAMVLLAGGIVGGIIGGTVAWLTSQSDKVENVFTDSDITVTLAETKEVFDMVPGWTIDKDPVVTIKAGSEDCWVFIQVTESENLDSYIAYTIDTHNWDPLVDANEDGVADNGVYYCEARDITKDRRIKVLGPGSYTDPMGDKADFTVTWDVNQVCVKPSVTKSMMEDAKTTPPTLSFTAYASQLYKNNTEKFTPAQAWDNVKPATTS